MKIWEIKAQSLRIMFSDTDLNFSQEEFENGVIEDNPNTREKVVRMNDSIRRAIDEYYNYVGEHQQRMDATLHQTDGEFDNYVDLSTESNFGTPTRVDVIVYDDIDGQLYLRMRKDQIDFEYDFIAQRIIPSEDYRIYGNDVRFGIHYLIEKKNIPETVDDMTYDISILSLPPGFQRMIPYFVKAELYEEDEPESANLAKQSFYRFLVGLRKPFMRVQTKVKHPKVFDK